MGNILRQQIEEYFIKETFPYFVSTYIQHVLPEINNYMKIPSFEQVYLNEMKRLKQEVVELVIGHHLADSWVDVKDYLKDEQKLLPQALFEEIAIRCATTVQTLKAQMDMEHKHHVMIERSQLDHHYKVARSRYKRLTQFIREEMATFQLYTTSLISILSMPKDEFKPENPVDLLQATQYYNQQLITILDSFIDIYSHQKTNLRFKQLIQSHLEQVQFTITPNEKYHDVPYIKKIKSGPNRCGIVDELDGAIWKVAIRREVQS